MQSAGYVIESSSESDSEDSQSARESAAAMLQQPQQRELLLDAEAAVTVLTAPVDPEKPLTSMLDVAFQVERRQRKHRHDRKSHRVATEHRR